MPAQEWTDSFGAVLARLRRAAGLTQEQLADRAELSVRAISSLECGTRHPRRLTVDRIADALGLTAAARAGLREAAMSGRRRGAPVGALGALLPGGGSPGPILGRRAELAELRAHLTGDGPAVLNYDGEAGIGKSRLLVEAATLGARAGMTVLAGVGRRRADPYCPVADALADHVRRTPASVLAAQLRGCAGLELILPEVAHRLRPGSVPGAPTAAPAPQPDEPRPALPQPRRLVFEAVGRFLENAAGTGRLLLVLDDLHWAGPETVELIAYLVRRSWPHLRLVTACRIGDVTPGGPLGLCAADLARLHLVRGRTLSPLPMAEAEELITTTAGGTPLPSAARSRILRLAGGLPLFLVELTRAALDQQRADPPSGDLRPAGPPPADAAPAWAGAGGGGHPVPWHLRLAVVQQLAALPEPVVLLLRRMAVAGPTVTVRQLVTDERDLEPLLDRLDLARRYRVVDETAHGFRFRYPLVGEVLANGLGPHRRRLWRRSADVGHAPVRTA